MFTSTHHHPQVLGPQCYTSREHFEREKETIFLPSWHCVGAMAELPRDGDFKTVELLEHPLLIRREGDQVHTYLNVCSHRYCALTSAEQGNMPRIKCQYHGWEYDACGRTGKIPEAKNFKPMTAEMLGLTKFRTETCGQLIFVALTDEAPSLRDFLGDGYDRLDAWFHQDLTYVGSAVREIDANWKVVIENGLESYHITECHSKTFGVNPPEESCRHELHDGWTALNVDYGDEKSFMVMLDDTVNFMVGTKPSHEYDHLHYFPHLMPARLSVNIWFESILPVGPGKTHNLGVSFCNAGKKGRLWTRWMGFWITRWARRWHVQVNGEDVPVILGTQQGLRAPRQPKGGLISTREERLYYFQEYVQRMTGCERFDAAEVGGNTNTDVASAVDQENATSNGTGRLAGSGEPTGR